VLSRRLRSKRMSNLSHIPDDVLDKAAAVALAQLRREKHDPNWVPKLHNGRELFEERVLKIAKEIRSR
jgi:hypothetical protein